MIKFFQKIFGMFTKKEQKEVKPQVIICDSSALIYAFEKCKQIEHILIPSVSYNVLRSVARGEYVGKRSWDFENEILSKQFAKVSLAYWEDNKDRITIVPRLASEDFFVAPTYKVRNTTAAVVALACSYAMKGYEVCVKTRTYEIRDFVNMQNHNSIQVEFLGAS